MNLDSPNSTVIRLLDSTMQSLILAEPVFAAQRDEELLKLGKSTEKFVASEIAMSSLIRSLDQWIKTFKELDGAD